MNEATVTIHHDSPVVWFRAVGPHSKDIPVPAYETKDASGMDLRAAAFGASSNTFEDYILRPMDRILVRTGYAIEIPNGYEGQIRTRSGFALRRGLVVVNAPGTIDSDFRGEIGVILGNYGKESIKLIRGNRIAQIVIAPVAKALIRTTLVALSDTERGEGGFGSTGE